MVSFGWQYDHTVKQSLAYSLPQLAKSDPLLLSVERSKVGFIKAHKCPRGCPEIKVENLGSYWLIAMKWLGYNEDIRNEQLDGIQAQLFEVDAINLLHWRIPCQSEQTFQTLSRLRKFTFCTTT